MSDESNIKFTEDETGETVGGQCEPLQDNKSQAEIEHEQEVQLRNKFPGMKGPGASAFLQKRLSKGTKYFDSGDYNMAKAKVGVSSKLLPGPSKHKVLVPDTSSTTGDAIPTPETVPARKASLQQSKLVTT